MRKFSKIIYLGNKKELQTLNYGEIIFGAEGTFRSFVVCDNKKKFITNIHGITLFNENITNSVFIKSMLDYIVEKGVIDAVKVGGHGGSFAQKYWKYIVFPLFPDNIKKVIAKLYHNPDADLAKFNLATLDNFLELDNEFNKQAGIYELDKTAKKYKEHLDETINKIANDEYININFDFI